MSAEPYDIRHKEWESAPRSHLLVSSLRITETPSHWRIAVWNRGGKAGDLVVNAADGPAICDRLLPPAERDEW